MKRAEETWLDILHRKGLICREATYKGGEYYICEINTKFCPFAATQTWEECDNYWREE